MTLAGWMSLPDVRSTLMDFAVHLIDRDIGRGSIGRRGGRRNRGNSFAAWVADRLHLPDATCAQETESDLAAAQMRPTASRPTGASG